MPDVVVPPYTLACSSTCSLRSGTEWGDKATAWLLRHRSYRQIIAAAAEDRYKLNVAVLSRHKKHIILSVPEAKSDTDIPVAPARATNIEILEAIITRGFQNQKNWRPTIGDTMKAMDMWFKLTSGNPFDELLDTLAQASIGDETPEVQGGPVGVEAAVEEIEESE